MAVRGNWSLVFIDDWTPESIRMISNVYRAILYAYTLPNAAKLIGLWFIMQMVNDLKNGRICVKMGIPKWLIQCSCVTPQCSAKVVTN